MRKPTYLAGFCVVLASLSTSLSAGAATTVPEIDGGTITTGLGLLTGAVLLVRARLRAR